VAAKSKRDPSSPAIDPALQLENLPIPYLIVNEHGAIIFANAKSRVLFGPAVANKQITDLIEVFSVSRDIEPAELQEKPQDIEMRPRSLTLRIKGGDNLRKEMLCNVSYEPQSGTTSIIVLPGTAQLPLAVQRVAESIFSARLEDTLDVISDEARILCGADRAYIKLYDEERNVLVFKALSSFRKKEAFPEDTSTINRGMTGYAFAHREAYLSGDVRREPPEKYYPLFRDTLSQAVVPLLVHRGNEPEKCHGVLSLHGRRVNQFGPDCLALLKTFALHASLAVAQFMALHEIQRLYTELAKEQNSTRDVHTVGVILHHSKNIVRDILDEMETVQNELGEHHLAKRRNATIQRRTHKLHDLYDLLGVTIDQLKTKPKKTTEYVVQTVVDLRWLALRVMNMVPIANVDIEIELDCLEREYLAFGRWPQLLLILYNLLINAIAAIKRTGRHGRIVISIDDVPGQLSFRRIKIQDDGPGLPRPVLKFIREGQRYTGSPGGTGLGLISVRETVKDLNGRIDVQSEFGKYTRFVIDLQGPKE
jgi:hypothetical protein